MNDLVQLLLDYHTKTSNVYSPPQILIEMMLRCEQINKEWNSYQQRGKACVDITELMTNEKGLFLTLTDYLFDVDSLKNYLLTTLSERVSKIPRLIPYFNTVLEGIKNSLIDYLTTEGKAFEEDIIKKIIQAAMKMDDSKHYEDFVEVKNQGKQFGSKSKAFILSNALLFFKWPVSNDFESHIVECFLQSTNKVHVSMALFFKIRRELAYYSKNLHEQLLSSMNIPYVVNEVVEMENETFEKLKSTVNEIQKSQTIQSKEAYKLIMSTKKMSKKPRKQQNPPEIKPSSICNEVTKKLNDNTITHSINIDSTLIASPTSFPELIIVNHEDVPTNNPNIELVDQNIELVDKSSIVCNQVIEELDSTITHSVNIDSTLIASPTSFPELIIVNHEDVPTNNPNIELVDQNIELVDKSSIVCNQVIEELDSTITHSVNIDSTLTSSPTSLDFHQTSCENNSPRKEKEDDDTSGFFSTSALSEEGKKMNEFLSEIKEQITQTLDKKMDEKNKTMDEQNKEMLKKINDNTMLKKIDEQNKAMLKKMDEQNIMMREQNKAMLKKIDEQNKAILKKMDEQNNAMLEKMDEQNIMMRDQNKANMEAFKNLIEMFGKSNK